MNMQPVRDFWKHRNYVRWSTTQWCNYSCSYCQQQHARKVVYKGASAHWADNRPWEEWFVAFERHFSAYPTSFHMTGGETLLDRVNTVPLLRKLLEAPWCDWIDVDTNASFKPEEWDLPLEKLELMCSFHPDHVTPAAFLKSVENLLKRGWRVSSVAVVLMPNGTTVFQVLADELKKLGLPINLLSFYGSLDGYSEHERELFAKHIPDQDWYGVDRSPKGKLCLYNSLAYEVDVDGSVAAGCLRTFGPQHRGSLWNEALPALPGEMDCPKTTCQCVERYSFTLDTNVAVNAKMLHAKRLLEKQTCV